MKLIPEPITLRRREHHPHRDGAPPISRYLLHQRKYNS